MTKFTGLWKQHAKKEIALFKGTTLLRKRMKRNKNNIHTVFVFSFGWLVFFLQHTWIMLLNIQNHYSVPEHTHLAISKQEQNCITSTC